MTKRSGRRTQMIAATIPPMTPGESLFDVPWEALTAEAEGLVTGVLT